MKKFVLLFCVFLMFTMTVNGAPIYKYEDTVPITDSVSLTTVKEFYPDYNMSYSYIKADISDDSIDLTLLKSDDGVDILETVGNLSTTNENTLAAVNGDFFSWYKGNTGFSLGIEKQNGQLFQSPINPDTMATVAYNNTSVLMSYLDFHIMVVAPNWQYKEIRHLNKHTSYYGDILMYTSDFNGGMSPAPGGEVVEMVVEDGKVREFRRNMPPVEIPENGCVLVVSEGVTTFLTSNFSIDDEIKFDYYITPSLDEYKTAFGAGAMIVSEGQDVGKLGDYSHTVAGNNPRTAMGIDKDGKTLYIVTVDGRQGISRGMKMSNLAELMISLGCHTAVNLDGGGSTRMVASTLWDDEMHTVNNPTEDRKVINAVGITLIPSENSGVPSGIAVKADAEFAFVGHPALLRAVVFDENMRPVNINEAEIVWTSSEGVIENGVFKSDVGGLVKVTASWGGFTAECIIEVIDNVTGFDVVKKLNLEIGNEHPLEICGFDEHGHYFKIEDLSYVEITSSNSNVAVVIDGIITAVGNGNAVVSISKNGVTANISVAVGSYTYNYHDDFEDSRGSFVSYPASVKGSYALTNEQAFSGVSSGKLSYNFTVPAEDTSEDVAKGAYYALAVPVSVADDCKDVYINVFTKNEFKHTLKLQFTDGRGNIAIVPLAGEMTVGTWRGMHASIPDNVKRPLKLTRVYVLYTPGEEKDRGDIYLDDLSLTACVDYKTDGTLNDTILDDNENSNVTKTLRIGALSASSVASPMTKYINGRTERYVSEYGSGAFIGIGGSFGISNDESILYVRLDTSKGGIRKTDSKQWTSLSEALKASDKNNVFILSDHSIFGNDEFENEVVCDILADSGKNVFVVTCSDAATYKNIKGVHYFTLDNTYENVNDGLVTKAKSVVEFYFGDKITFEFKEV